MLFQSRLSVAVSAFLAVGLHHGASLADEALNTSIRQPASYAVLIEQGTSTVGVTLDFAKVLSFNRPARTIIIGNPGIADGALSDESTLVLTGKSVGSTNLIVLGDAGREIANLTVNVVSNGRQLTTIHHGAAHQVFSCADTCRPVQPSAAGK